MNRGSRLLLVLTAAVALIALALPAMPVSAQAVDPADTAELVFVNQLENQMAFDFYEGFLISLDKLPDFLDIAPRGRFVRVMLPPGTYHLNGIGTWTMSTRKFFQYARDIAQEDLVLAAGKTTFFPYVLYSKLESLGKGSYNPDVRPVRATEKDLAGFRAEYAAAVKSGSPGAPAPRSASTLLVSAADIGAPVEAALDQDRTPFRDFAADNHLAYPEQYVGENGEPFFPRLLSVDAARHSVEIGGYLPRKGSLYVAWGNETSKGFNGHYERAALTHVFSGTQALVRVRLMWIPDGRSRIVRDLFVRFDAAPPLPDVREERKLADGTRVVIEDSLVQVIAPNPWDDFKNLRFGSQPMVAAVRSLFNDSFDFLYVAPAQALGGGPSGEAVKVMNDTEGVGLNIFKSPLTARLRSVIRLVVKESFVEGWSLMCHELMHSWGNYVIESEDGGHWGNSTAAGKLGGIEVDTLTQLGPGKYQAHALDTYHDWWLPFGRLELYLMGLAHSSEVPPTRIFKGIKVLEEVRKYMPGDYVVFSAASTKTITIADIISKNGPRRPAYGAAPRGFRALCVVVTERELSPLETRPIRESLAAFADPTPLTFGQGNEIAHNFAAATRGRGTFQVDGLLKELKSAENPAPR